MPEPAGLLYGPYPLRQDTVKQLVIFSSPATYVLGNSDAGVFHARCVGRSDIDVAARIRGFVGFYTEFKFAYCGNALTAFEGECRLYHELGSSLESAMHPARQARSLWR